MVTRRYPSAPASVDTLAAPLTFPFSGRTAPNRLLKAAMSELLSTWDPTDVSRRGIPTPEIITLYRHWGAGGWGQILTGNLMVDPAHLEAAGNLSIGRDVPFSGERFEAFSQLAAAAKAHGALVLGQISHPGRQTEESIQPHPISASDIALDGSQIRRKFAQPRAATEEDIAHIIESFAHAAEFLDKAGFDGVELHGAHGYLLSQFLSRSTNKRTDKYGGSLENRMRLTMEIARAIQSRVSKNFILGIKINSIELQPEGFTTEEAIEFAEALEAARFDYIEISAGTYERSAIRHFREETRPLENYFVPEAKRIVPHLTKTKTYTSGGFKTLAGMANVLKITDGIGIGTAACQEPRLAHDLLIGKVEGIIIPSFDMEDFGRKLFCAGAHIRQISKDQEPLDLSDQAIADGVWGDAMAQLGRIATDPSHRTVGHADMSQPTEKYREVKL